MFTTPLRVYHQAPKYQVSIRGQDAPLMTNHGSPVSGRALCVLHALRAFEKGERAGRIHHFKHFLVSAATAESIPSITRRTIHSRWLPEPAGASNRPRAR